jgi:hypothetical protein
MIDTDGRCRQAWLDYAWRVVTCADSAEAHYVECTRLIGQVDDRIAGEGKLRWPGSVNSCFRPEHSVLFVGSVHREFHIGGNGKSNAALIEQERILVEANRRWLAEGRGPSNDAAYLDATARAYEQSIPLWPRGGVVMRILRKLGDDVDEVAWVNLARCQAPPSTTNETKLRAACQRRDAFPLAHVIDALRPAAVFVAVLGTVDRVTRAGRQLRSDGTILDGGKWHPLVYVFDGRQRCDPTHVPFDVWSDGAAIAVGERRGLGCRPGLLRSAGRIRAQGMSS